MYNIILLTACQNIFFILYIFCKRRF